MKKKSLIYILIIWTALIVFSFIWNYKIIISNNHEVVLNKSKAFFEQILSARAWNSSHGGVYVPVTDKTQPNKYLEDPLREVVTLDGLKLTKINPAYMTRQISEINQANYDIHFHITSANPIRPANKADDWETKSLNKFENGTTQILELVKTDSSEIYRFMAPLTTNQSCLHCHAKQGYKLGDIRGGISVSFPATLYLKVANNQLFYSALVHFLIMLLGIVGLIFFYKKSNVYVSVVKTKNQELVQLNATKDRFFSIIAHDLKSPFSSILGFSEILKDEVEQIDTKTIKRYASLINSSAQNSYALLENLLEWARMQQGQIQFEPEKLVLNDAVIAEIQNLQHTADQKNIKLTNNTPENLTIKADYNMLLTILRNLISNAIKFTPEGGQVKVEAKIEGEVKGEKSQVVISVSDTGIGMTKETIENLFKIESSISTRGTNNERGTGIGLLLCKDFIEKHKGNIAVKSMPGKGSTFTIYLPK